MQFSGPAPVRLFPPHRFFPITSFPRSWEGGRKPGEAKTTSSPAWPCLSDTSGFARARTIPAILSWR